MTEISGTADIELTFDWCWQVTGAPNFKPDLMTITVEVKGEGTCADTGTKISGEIQSAQPQTEPSAIAWQKATVRINGVNNQTRIVIRPTNADPAVSNPDRKQNRWYLDNIKIVTK